MDEDAPRAPAWLLRRELSLVVLACAIGLAAMDGWPADRLEALDLPYPSARDDDTVAYADTARVLASYRPAPRLTTVDGAGHFFHGRLGEVSDCFAALIAELSASH